MTAANSFFDWAASLTRFVRQDTARSEEVNDALDAASNGFTEVEALTNAAIKLPAGETSAAIGNVAARKGKILSFHATTGAAEASIVAVDVATVAGVSAAVATVSANIASVNTAAANIAAIIAAPTEASNAASSAASAAASYDAFDDRNLGAKASDPTLDNDGNALIEGAQYFNTTIDRQKYYTGSAWNVAFGDSADVTYTASGTGAVATTVQAKLRETVSAKDFGAVGDGVEIDTTAMAALKVAVDANPTSLVNFAGGRYATTGTFWPNNVSPTTMYFDKASVLGLFDGTAASPNSTDNDPTLFAQKYTKFDNGTDRFAHNVGGVFGSVYVKGTDLTGASETDGTWLGMLGNAVMAGTNQGSPGAPDYDAYGNMVGVAGFARSTGYPGSGNIVCGMWGYAEGPTLDATTHTNLPATNWSLVGSEVNVQINHPDIGTQTLLVGKGSSVGQLVKNYRAPGTGVMDWTFGAVIDGTPDDDNYTGTDVSLWSGHYTGILIDKIKSRGILFGKYFANGSYGIEFPSSYAGYAQRPAAAVYVGDNVINMAQYTGATFNDQDFWHNAGALYFRYGGSTNKVVQESPSGSVGIGGAAVGSFSVRNVGALLENYFRSTHSAGPSILLQNANNSAGTAVATVSGTRLGGLYYGGYDGTTYTNTANIEASAAETHSSGARGTYLLFTTTSIGAASRTERMRIDPSGNFLVQTAGTGLRVKEGGNAKQGASVLVAGSVVVANTSVTANSRILLTSNVDGGTPGFLRISARTNGTSFTITSSSGTDTSTVAWQIFEPA